MYFLYAYIYWKQLFFYNESLKAVMFIVHIYLLIKSYFKAYRTVPVKISSDLKHLSLLHCIHERIGITQNQLAA